MRPEWKHKNITELQFREIAKIGPIVSIQSKWEFTSADTSREWLEVCSRSGEIYVLPYYWREILMFVGHSSNPGLFDYTYEGKQMLKTLNAIDAWEAENAHDIAEFERLKRKFGIR